MCDQTLCRRHLRSPWTKNRRERSSCVYRPCWWRTGDTCCCCLPSSWGLLRKNVGVHITQKTLTSSIPRCQYMVTALKEISVIEIIHTAIHDTKTSLSTTHLCRPGYPRPMCDQSVSRRHFRSSWTKHRHEHNNCVYQISWYCRTWGILNGLLLTSTHQGK